MPGGRLTLLLLLVMCFASFGWALRSHFVCRRMSGLMHLTAAVGISLGSLQALAIFLATSAGAIQCGIAGLLYAVSLVIFWWTTKVTRDRRLSVAFSADKPHHLLKRGPYRFVRHPFYASYGLFWLAGKKTGKETLYPSTQ